MDQKFQYLPSSRPRMFLAMLLIAPNQDGRSRSGLYLLHRDVYVLSFPYNCLGLDIDCFAQYWHGKDLRGCLRLAGLLFCKVHLFAQAY